METDATYRGTVYPWQCDHVGHMNIMWYVGKFDEATWHLFHELGIIVVGLGFALMVIIGIAGETPTVGVGIGGAIVIVGAAFIVRSIVVRSSPPPQTPVPPSPPTTLT